MKIEQGDTSKYMYYDNWLVIMDMDWLSSQMPAKKSMQLSPAHGLYTVMLAWQASSGPECICGITTLITSMHVVTIDVCNKHDLCHGYKHNE